MKKRDHRYRDRGYRYGVIYYLLARPHVPSTTTRLSFRSVYMQARWCGAADRISRERGNAAGPTGNLIRRRPVEFFRYVRLPSLRVPEPVAADGAPRFLRVPRPRYPVTGRPEYRGIDGISYAFFFSSNGRSKVAARRTAGVHHDRRCPFSGADGGDRTGEAVARCGGDDSSVSRILSPTRLDGPCRRGARTATAASQESVLDRRGWAGGRQWWRRPFGCGPPTSGRSRGGGDLCECNAAHAHRRTHAHARHDDARARTQTAWH